MFTSAKFVLTLSIDHAIAADATKSFSIVGALNKIGPGKKLLASYEHER